MIVMKFGGTSVKDQEAVGRVVHVVRSERRPRPASKRGWGRFGWSR